MPETVEISASELSELQKRNIQLESEVNFLKQQLKELQRMIFGTKSERFIPSDSNQLNMFGTEEALSAQPLEEQEVKTSSKSPVKKQQRPVRNLLPSHLPREEEIIEPEDFKEGSKKIGEEITEILEYKPGQIYVRRIVRPKYVFDKEDGVSIGKLPNLPIPKGNAGAGLLAHIQVSKWVDHLPFYRQIQMMNRQGIALSQSTMNGWFKATSDLLQPLYYKQVSIVQQQSYLCADESPIKVLEQDNQKSKRTGYHWVYYAPEKNIVVFDYQPTRSRSGPEEFLKDFSGTLQTDGYKVYDKLSLKNPITQLSCMAHARRYFEKALDNDHHRASYVLGQIKSLYMIERKIREAESDNKTTKEIRQRDAIPILNNLKSWLDDELNKVTPKSKIGIAIRYTLNLWDKLIAYTTEGRYLIDNNRIENTIRPLAIGRKNYLFAGSNKAAQRAAMMYSFFATCKLHGVEPYAWLNDVLNRIPNLKVNVISEELLPHKWTPNKMG